MLKLESWRTHLGLPGVVLAGCLISVVMLIEVPVSAQQASEAPETEIVSYGSDEGDRIPMFSIGAIILGLVLLGGLRLYQQGYLMNNQPFLDQARQRLLRQIARLDDRYACGKIAEDAYQRRRERLKEEVIELTLRQKGVE